MTMRIGLVTYANFPHLTPDDRLLADALERRDLVPVPAVWDRFVDWASLDLVVFRSCWDYHRRPEEFLTLLSRIETLGVAIENPPSLVRWNASKTYLRDLEERGTPIPPTHWISAGDAVRSREILAALGWPTAVVKPVVGAGADGVRLVTLADPDVVLQGPVMIQRFLSEVAATGEWSFVFLGGTYSHAVLKHPGAGEFRVQEHLGGTSTLVSPEAPAIAWAEGVIARLEVQPLYARVDAINDPEGGLTLMELELIEPTLFLGLGNAAVRFAEAIAARVAID
jgi:glutathione synthase/RimK-type ligase-like ATP-grasp enzyme